MSAKPLLESLAGDALRRARETGQAQIAIARLPLDREPEIRPAPGAPDAWAFVDASGGLGLTAHGVAAHCEAGGPRRFEQLRAAMQAIRRRLRVADAELRGVDLPIWVGGFAFDCDARAEGDWTSFPAARFVLPERMQIRTRDGCFEHRATQVRPGESIDAIVQRLAPRDPAPRRAAPTRPGLQVEEDEAHYLSRVRAALEAVQRGEVEKLVVAESLEVRADTPFDVGAVFDALRERHAGCRTFAIVRGGRAFVGASPERLVNVRSGRVFADALAGSAPRGTSPDEDAQLARDLRESKKEQEEHAVVVRALREALEPVCTELVLPESPEVKAWPGFQHLFTPARGQLRGDVDMPLLALARRVHPTPAVSGAPGSEARRWLRSHEGLDRGWYAGGVGWMDANGEGELWVAIRSALLLGQRARVFAGGGIVSGSDPRAELRETHFKLNAALCALGERKS